MRQIEELYRNYKRDVYSYLYRLTRDPLLAEDLLSETFVNAIRGISRFRGESSVKTWLFGIARNLWLRELKKTRPTVAYRDFLGKYVSGAVEEDFLARQTLERVEVLLQSKDERTREVVRLRANGYSYGEIGRELGISESSARVIEYRARQWLREKLREEDLL